MYDPSVGRWLSEDPSGLKPDVNPYRYVGNSPTNYTDPSGLSKKASGSVKPRNALQHAAGNGRVGYYVGVFSDYEDDWDTGGAMDLANGHAAIGFAQGFGGDCPPQVYGVYGFYPGDRIRDDNEKGFRVGRVYRVSQQDYLRMLGEALRWKKAPGKYDKTKRNCTTFVKEVGDEGGLLGGVDPISISTPKDWQDPSRVEMPTYVPGELGDFLEGDVQSDSYYYPDSFDDE